MHLTILWWLAVIVCSIIAAIVLIGFASSALAGLSKTGDAGRHLEIGFNLDRYRLLGNIFFPLLAFVIVFCPNPDLSRMGNQGTGLQWTLPVTLLCLWQLWVHSQMRRLGKQIDEQKKWAVQESCKSPKI